MIIMTVFEQRKAYLTKQYEELISRPNAPLEGGNGIFERYQLPILTAAHAPLHWQYDYNPSTNPYFMERLGINCVFNPGAIYLNSKYYVVARVEGNDRKSFFAIAESDNRSEEHTSELQSRENLVCRLLLEKKNR